ARCEARVAIVGEPENLKQRMAQLETATASGGVQAKTAAFLNLLRNLTEHLTKSNPDQLDTVLKQMGEVAGGFSLDAMVALLGERERPQAVAGSIDVVSAMTERMSDKSVGHFLAGCGVSPPGAGGPPARRPRSARSRLSGARPRARPAAAAAGAGRAGGRRL